MIRKIIGVKLSPRQRGHLIDEIQTLKGKLYFENVNINNCFLYMNNWTYRVLVRGMCCRGLGYVYYPSNNDYGTVCGLVIKIDNRLRDFEIQIREEDNMDNLNDFEYFNALRNFFAEPSNETRGKLPIRYIINDGAVILFWSDGDKTIVKRSEDDNFDPVKGFLWAYFQKHSGLSKTKANKYLRDLDYDYDKYKLIRF